MLFTSNLFNLKYRIPHIHLDTLHILTYLGTRLYDKIYDLVFIYREYISVDTLFQGLWVTS